jgi:hypothetical protein
MRDPIHTTECEVIYIHAYVHAYQARTHVHALHVYPPSFQCTTQQYIPYTNVPHYYALMRAGYVLHSLECLERGVVDKCCSNVLRSLRAYEVLLKAMHTGV